MLHNLKGIQSFHLPDVCWLLAIVLLFGLQSCEDSTMPINDVVSKYAKKPKTIEVDYEEEIIPWDVVSVKRLKQSEDDRRLMEMMGLKLMTHQEIRSSYRKQRIDGCLFFSDNRILFTGKYHIDSTISKLPIAERHNKSSIVVDEIIIHKRGCGMKYKSKYKIDEDVELTNDGPNEIKLIWDKKRSYQKSNDSLYLSFNGYDYFGLDFKNISVFNSFKDSYKIKNYKKNEVLPLFQGEDNNRGFGFVLGYIEYDFSLLIDWDLFFDSMNFKYWLQSPGDYPLDVDILPYVIE